MCRRALFPAGRSEAKGRLTFWERDVCHCDKPELYDETKRKRSAHGKPKICCECEQNIPVGKTYWSMKGLWNGRFETYVMCFQCRREWDDLIHYDRELCMCFGELREYKHLTEEVT